MICMLCKKSPATVHMTDIHNGKKREFHICQECAKNQGIVVQAQDALAGLIEKYNEAAAREVEQLQNIRCEKCSMTYDQFRKGGRLGCPNDYKAFEELLMPLLERMHGSVEHVGTSPGKSTAKGREDEAMRIPEAIRRLKEELSRAVAAEDYECAARLRDEIRTLKEDEDEV